MFAGGRTMSEKVKVVIVEDHQATLDGLALGLERESDFEVVGTSCNSDEALSLTERLRPDIVLLDLHLPGSRGPRSMIEEFARMPACKLIIFSAESRMAFIQSVLSMGVSAYLLKSERVSKVADTIRAVHRGGKAILSQEL